jgi:hypothetical protein
MDTWIDLIDKRQPHIALQMNCQVTICGKSVRHRNLQSETAVVSIGPAAV